MNTNEKSKIERTRKISIIIFSIITAIILLDGFITIKTDVFTSAGDFIVGGALLGLLISWIIDKPKCLQSVKERAIAEKITYDEETGEAHIDPLTWEKISD